MVVLVVDGELSSISKYVLLWVVVEFCLISVGDDDNDDYGDDNSDDYDDDITCCLCCWSGNSNSNVMCVW